jgi:S1-C subfamily serine protease
MRQLLLAFCLLAIAACGTNRLRNESSIPPPSATNTPNTSGAPSAGLASQNSFADVVEFSDHRVYPAKLVSSDPPSALAVLQVDERNLPGLGLTLWRNGREEQVRITLGELNMTASRREP